jgi:hypothetical protein
MGAHPLNRIIQPSLTSADITLDGRVFQAVSSTFSCSRYHSSGRSSLPEDYSGPGLFTPSYIATSPELVGASMFHSVVEPAALMLSACEVGTAVRCVFELCAVEHGLFQSQHVCS